MFIETHYVPCPLNPLKYDSFIVVNESHPPWAKLLSQTFNNLVYSQAPDLVCDDFRFWPPTKMWTWRKQVNHLSLQGYFTIQYVHGWLCKSSTCSPNLSPRSLMSLPWRIIFNTLNRIGDLTSSTVYGRGHHDLGVEVPKLVSCQYIVKLYPCHMCYKTKLDKLEHLS